MTSVETQPRAGSCGEHAQRIDMNAGACHPDQFSCSHRHHSRTYEHPTTIMTAESTSFVTVNTMLQPTNDPISNTSPSISAMELEALLRDAYTLAVALSDLSEDARATDGRAMVLLIKPKLTAALEPLQKFEMTPAGAVQVQEMGLKRLYKDTKAILDAEEEADT
jgi:hypothetical protein